MEYVKVLIASLLLGFIVKNSSAQVLVLPTSGFGPNHENPYGRINPNAPSETTQFSFMIGKLECQSISRNQDQKRKEPIPMIWSSEYFLNGLENG